MISCQLVWIGFVLALPTLSLKYKHLMFLGDMYSIYNQILEGDQWHHLATDRLPSHKNFLELHHLKVSV